MDAQIQERLAKQGAEILRLGDEVKALKRQLQKETRTPRGAALEAEVEALKRRKDSPSAAAMATMSGLVEEAQEEVARLEAREAASYSAGDPKAILEERDSLLDELQAIREDRDMFHDALGAIRAEWDIPDGEEALSWLRSSFTVQRTDREKAEAALSTYEQRPWPWEQGPLPQALPDWRRDLWVDIYKHTTSTVDADGALKEAEKRFGPKPLDSNEDGSEG